MRGLTVPTVSAPFRASDKLIGVILRWMGALRAQMFLATVLLKARFGLPITRAVSSELQK